MDKPSGIVTFLFTDIEGSTKLSQELPDKLPMILEEHNSILKHAFESSNGFIFEMVGDAFYCSFENAVDAVKAAVEAQLNLSKLNQSYPVKVRMGIHSGTAQRNGKKYNGYITLARTARIMSVANGEQILISGDTYKLASESEFKSVLNSVSFRDLGERKLKDLIQPIRLFQILSKGLREEFPILKTLDVRPNNLPVQLSGFVGRENEMSQIKNLIKKNRLLTLIGSGGTGKTRLTLQSTADMIDEFADGVWLTELENLIEPALLPNLIMQTIGITEIPDHNVKSTLIDFLKDKELLIILDNCEHMIEETAKLAEELLKKCPKLKILATSREPLNCRGEQKLRINPMPIPDISEKKSFDELAANESVELFVERASSINPLFKLNEKNANDIAKICCRLDGIPLAIELAAARTNIFPVHKILERLDDRFRFLIGGKRTSLKRQQTLTALIDWSYDLLDEKEKMLWKRLSVFSGGWTIEAAEEVCCDETISPDSIADLLSDLTEKSIIIFIEEKSRFRMLETMRQYGEKKLKEQNDFQKFSSAHLKYFKQLAVDSTAKLRGKQMQHWLNILHNETGNMGKALKYSINYSLIDDGMLMAGSLGDYWKIKGHKTEAIKWYEAFLQTNYVKTNSAYCLLLSQFAYFLKLQGNLTKAKNYFKECLRLSSEIGFTQGITASINGLGLIEFEKGKYDEAEKLYDENLKYYESTNNKSGIAHTLNNIATIYLNIGENDKAYALYNKSLELFRQLDDLLGITRTLNNLVELEYERGNHSRANELINENLKFNREIGNKRSIAITLSNKGTLAFLQKDYENAIESYCESLEIYNELGDKYYAADTMINLGNVKIEQNKIEEAKRFFEEGLSAGRLIEAKLQIALSLFGLGIAASLEGHIEQSLDYWKASLLICIELGSKRDSAINILRIIEFENKDLNNINKAKLLGYLKNYFEEDKFKLSQSEENTFNELIKNLRKSLPEFEKHFIEGKSLEEEQAMKLIIFGN